MRAVTWHGRRDVRVDEVPDPRIHDPTDAIVRVTSTAICGSDLHLYLAFDMVRRGGTVSISGVYGGQLDPLPLFQLFDKQLQLRMGQANVLAHMPDLLPLVTGSDVLGTEDFASHRISIDEAPQGYERFQKKQDGAIKYVIRN